jgi:hypothetical protein
MGILNFIPSITNRRWQSRSWVQQLCHSMCSSSRKCWTSTSLYPPLPCLAWCYFRIFELSNIKMIINYKDHNVMYGRFLIKTGE